MLLSTLLRHFDDNVPADGDKTSKSSNNCDKTTNTDKILSEKHSTENHSTENHSTEKQSMGKQSMGKQSMRNQSMGKQSTGKQSMGKQSTELVTANNNKYIPGFLKYGNIEHNISYDSIKTCVANMLTDDKVTQVLSYFNDKELPEICSSLAISIIIHNVPNRYGLFNKHEPVLVISKEDEIYYAVSRSCKRQHKPWWFGIKEISQDSQGTTIVNNHR